MSLQSATNILWRGEVKPYFESERGFLSFLRIDSSLLGTSASKHRIDPSLLFCACRQKTVSHFGKANGENSTIYSFGGNKTNFFWWCSLSAKRVVQIRFLALLFSVSSPKKLPESLDSTPPLCMCEARASSLTPPPSKSQP